jgi:hypothetical protein
MTDFRRSSSSESASFCDSEFHLIVEFWKALRNDDELDSTIWKVLEPLERRVTDCLFFERPPDLATARNLTVQAIEILTGI